MILVFERIQPADGFDDRVLKQVLRLWPVAQHVPRHRAKPDALPQKKADDGFLVQFREDTTEPGKI